MNTYKIYTVDPDTKTKKYYGIDTEKGDKFEFESDKDIIEHVRKMRESTKIDYMWKRNHSISVLDEDGKVAQSFEDFEEHYNYFKEKRKNRKTYEKIWDYICGLWYKADNLRYKIIYGFERMFKGYDRRVAWSIDTAILELIKNNVPRLVENMHGCPNSYVVKAIKTLNPNVSDEDTKNSSGNDEQLNVGMALWKSDLNRLVEMCKLVTFYEIHGKQETEDEDWVDPHKYKIPYLEFSKEIDYEKLGKLVEENYNNIFSFLREHFTEMWD